MDAIKKYYAETYGCEPPNMYFSPGRINIIGEHIDYNGGHVFPCAISLGIYGTIKPLAEMKARLLSLNVKGGFFEVDLDKISEKPLGKWIDYPLGVVRVLQSRGYVLSHGFEMIVHGNLPNGAGLSSSAALEMLTIKMLVDMFGFKIERVDQALYCQEAENNYVGVKCGIMDQFTVAMGRRGHAVLLNSKNLVYLYAPLDISRNSLLIIDSGKKRSLSNSGYNKRREECAQALAILKKRWPIEKLCDLSMNQLRASQDLFDNYLLYRRARHCVSENERTIAAYQAMYNRDLVELGRLMFRSHNSLRRDYQVSCFELNTLVDFARKHHAKGARMTGAGFGGCALVLIKNSRVRAFINDVLDNYQKITNCVPSIYQVEICDGTRRLEEEK